MEPLCPHHSAVNGNPAVTLSDNDFTIANAGSPWGYTTNKDYHYYEATYAIRVVIRGQVIGAYTGTVVSRSGATLTMSFNADAAIAAAAAAGTAFMIYDDWTNQTAYQRRYVSLSDSAGIVSGTTNGYQWDG